METKDVIQAGRLRLGLTHQAFADKIGVSRGAVQQWEKGSTAPTRKHQPVIAKLLGITVSELLCIGDPGPVTSAEPGKSAANVHPLEAMRDQVANLPEPVRDVIGKLVASYLTAPSSEAGAEVLRTIEKLFPHDSKS